MEISILENAEGYIFDYFRNLTPPIEVLKVSRVSTLQENPIHFITSKSSGNYYFKTFVAKEKYVIEKLVVVHNEMIKRNIPVSKILSYSTESNPPFIVFSEVSGQPLSQIREKLSHKDLCSIYFELGTILGSFHSIRSFTEENEEGYLFGEIDGDGKVTKLDELGIGPFKDWRSLHLKLIESRLVNFKNSSFEDLVPMITSFFESESKKLLLDDNNVLPSFLHLDLNQKNIIISSSNSSNSEKMIISGIIDFDGSIFGASNEELMRTECANFKPPNEKDELRDSFLKGYREKYPESKTESPEIQEKRRRYYYLSRLLVHISCLVEYGENYKSNVQEVTETLRKEVLKVIKGEEILYDKNS